MLGKTAFIFSGQGSQYVGMGKSLYEEFVTVRNIFDEADELLKDNISEICFNGPFEKLQQTQNTQPAVLIHSIACYQLLKEHGIVPDMVAGLSLGEYSALVAADSIEFEQAVPLVRNRGKFMQEAVPEGKGTMAAILGLDRKEVLDICRMASDEGIVEAANYNCPGQVVISGEINAVNKAAEMAMEKGAKKVKVLSVSAPFHCSLLKPAALKLAGELEKVDINDAKLPMVSNVNAEFVRDGKEIKKLLIKQVNSSVLWEDCINKMIENGADTFVEVGPGKVLSGFVKKIDRNVKVLNVQDLETLKDTLNYFGG